MSLLRLLTTGKSLVGGNDTESRYRLSRQRLLPHFGPARNPFKDRGKSDPVHPEVGSPGDHGGNNASAAGRSSPIVGGKPAAAPQGEAKDRTLSASASGHRFAKSLRLRTAALLSRWKASLIRLPGRRSGKPLKPAIPRFTKQPVQGELSLDKIKVVRNDLSDADLEVLPTRQPAATPASAAPAARTEERAGGAEGTWRRVTAGLFGAGKAQPHEDQ